MSQFLTTSEGKIINVSAIAFVTTRRNPESVHRGNSPQGGAKVTYTTPNVPKQLIIGFSAAGSGPNGLNPLSLVMDGEEASDFLDQMATLGLDTTKLKEMISVPEDSDAS